MAQCSLKLHLNIYFKTMFMLGLIMLVGAYISGKIIYRNLHECSCLIEFIK